MPMDVETVETVVRAAMKLHNLCIDESEFLNDAGVAGGAENDPSGPGVQLGVHARVQPNHPPGGEAQRAAHPSNLRAQLVAECHRRWPNELPPSEYRQAVMRAGLAAAAAADQQLPEWMREQEDE